MLKTVIDTNVFLESLSTTSPYHKIFQELLKGNITLCISNEIFLEYEEILAGIFGPEILNLFINFILQSQSVEFILPSFRFYLIDTDPDDNKFVDAAISANADFIITSDHHFNKLKACTFPRVNVTAPAEFIENYIL
jgi:uncharacterized protein